MRKTYTYRDGKYIPTLFKATGKFYTEGIHIVDPQGRRFVPRGFNVAGGRYNNGGAWPNMTENSDVADGMKAWGCNTVRLTAAVGRTSGWMLLSERIKAGDSLEVARQKVLAEWSRMTNFWLSKGFVVMLEAHDLTYPHNVTAQNMEDVKQFWLDYAAVYKDNPYVWYNIANEPGMDVATWKTWHDDVTGAIRATGDDSIIVIDGRMFAADVDPPYLREDEMMPTLIRNHGNLIGSMHNYGTKMRTWASEAKMRNYFASAAAARVPMIIGEVGFSWDGSTNTGDHEGEKLGAHSSCEVANEFGVGVFWWVYAHADAYRIEDAATTSNITNPFRPGTAHLNEAGLMFKEYLNQSAAKWGSGSYRRRVTVMATKKKNDENEQNVPGGIELDKNGIPKTRLENVGMSTANHSLTVDTSGTSGVPLDEQKRRDLDESREAQETLEGDEN